LVMNVQHARTHAHTHTPPLTKCVYAPKVQKMLRISDFEKNRRWIMIFQPTIVYIRH